MIKKIAAWMVVPIMMLMPAFASAEFVVTFDQFLNSVDGGFDAFGEGTINIGGFSIDRTTTGGSFNASNGQFVAGNGTDFILQYDVQGGFTFDDVFAAEFAGQNPGAPYESGEITKFKFGADPFFLGDSYVLTFNGDSQAVSGSAPAYFQSSGNISTATFTFSTDVGSIISVGGTNKFSAVPEPASLLLVGSVVGGLGMIRRRRK